jgi:hypothetical protein
VFEYFIGEYEGRVNQYSHVDCNQPSAPEDPLAIKLCAAWAKLNAYYTRLDSLVTYYAVVTLHPYYNQYWERAWWDKPEWLTGYPRWGRQRNAREWLQCQVALFNDLYGTNTTDLEMWQDLCREVYIKTPLNSIKGCKKARRLSAPWSNVGWHAHEIDPRKQEHAYRLRQPDRSPSVWRSGDPIQR